MKPFLTLVLLNLALFGFGQNSDQTPVQKWGWLKVVGTQLCAEDGTPVALRGMSLYDSTNYGEYANAKALTWMRNDWKATVFRAAMYTAYSGQFIGDEGFKAEFSAIQAAIDAGLYVLADWHILTDGNPQENKEHAKDFFTQVATRFGSYPNVIYEICNEPNGGGVTWKETIKPYAMEIIPLIRAIAPQSVILVGTPFWSSRPQEAAADPLPQSNLMYVLHFYAGSHSAEDSLGIIDDVNKAGFPVFVTEWGTTNDQVKGALYVGNSLKWVQGLADRKISWANWSYGSRLEPASALKPLASTSGSWRVGELTESGLLLRSILRQDPDGPIFADSFDSGNFKGGDWVRDNVGLDSKIFYAGSGSARFEESESLKKTLFSAEASGFSAQFWYKTVGLKGKDQFTLEYSLDGSTWKSLLQIGPSKASSDWKQVTAALPVEVDGKPGLQIRLRSDFKTPNAQLWLDEFEVDAHRSL